MGSSSGSVALRISQGVGSWERKLGCVHIGGVVFLRTLRAKNEIACWFLKAITFFLSLLNLRTKLSFTLVHET